MLVKKSTMDQKINEYTIDLEHTQALLEDREKEIETLRSKLNAYENGISEAEAEQTSATFYVSDDIQEVKPVTRVSPNIINKLVELGYLSSNKRNDEFSLNLAVMVLVSEALEQIVFSFEQDIDGEEDDEDNDDPEFSMTRRA